MVSFIIMRLLESKLRTMAAFLNLRHISKKLNIYFVLASNSNYAKILSFLHPGYFWIFHNIACKIQLNTYKVILFSFSYLLSKRTYLMN